MHTEPAQSSRRASWSPSPAALLLIGVLLAVLTSCGTESSFTAADDLYRPRGLAVLDDGAIVVADAGNGRLLRLQAGEDPATLVDGLPVTWDGGPGGDTVIGVSGLVADGPDILYVVGEFRGERYRRAYRLTPGADPVPLTPDEEDLATGALVNPYDIAVADDRIFISDAGANAIFVVAPQPDPDAPADPATFATIPDVTIDGGSDIDPVPTGIAIGPDGAVYVALLTGAPFRPGTAAVLRLTDRNQDGDAAGPDELETVLDGLTAATDLAFTATGWLLTSEFSLDMAALSTDITAERAARYPGRVAAHCGDRTVTLSDTVRTPTSIATVDDRIIVTEEFADRVLELDLDETPWREPCTAYG